jgi:hypothetical protein
MDGAVAREFERTNSLILASEAWSKTYAKTPEIQAKLIKTESRLQRKLIGFFKDISKDASRMVNWHAYSQAINAYNIDVIVNDDFLDEAGSIFINVALADVALATSLGAQSGEQLYRRRLGLTPSSSEIQDIALNHVAELVGMKLGNDGKMIRNPKAEMNILETTRRDIRSSIATSIALGEDIQTATARLASHINNPDRAELIARTETVNSFGQGLKEFGTQSGAIGKEWDDTGANDECADNTAQGPIDIDENFSSGDDAPAAHPNCRCNMRLIYQNELDDNPDLFG